MSARNPAPFDSHRFVKHMTEAGMPLAQAEALAEEQGVMVDTHLATKQDMGELKTGLAVVKAELAMVKWMVSGVGFGMLLLLVQNFWPV